MTNGVANHHRISIISSFGYFYPPHGSTGLGRPAPTPQSSTSTTPLRTFGEATPSPILDNIARITTRSKTTTQDNSDSSRSSPPETVSPVDPVLLGGGMSSTEVNALSQAHSGLTLGKLAPKHIDYFSGENFQDFNEWHRQFEDIIRTSVVPLPEQGKVNTLYATLRGEARDVIDEMQPEDRNNYDKIISFLRSHFEKPQFQDAAKRELANCRQNAGEDVYSYSKRIKKAVYNFMRHEPQTKIQQKLLEEFVERLRLDLKFFVRPHKCKTFEDALEKAADYEALHKEASDNNLVYHPELHIFVPKADLTRRTTPETIQERMDPPMADNFRPREVRQFSNGFNRSAGVRPQNSNVTCYKCGRNGHFANVCRTSMPPPRNNFNNRRQFPIRNNPQPNSNYRPNPRERIDHSRPIAQRNPISQQHPDTYDRSNVLAVEQTPAPDTTNPCNQSLLEEKDAHIAALIARNNALADIAYATREQNTHSNSEETSRRTFSSSSNSSKLPYTMLVVLALAAQASAFELPPATLRQPASQWARSTVRKDLNDP
ncbi:unnamed protein product [Cylicocyclus nassatus]|uniref:CCHC-type domain-containing protein n=1 Tax=Cylicocyclus nassatus TaxID=53992 RepID=A0AA36GHK1_CYLNA|nr:unnamed protein product [Cylicocyclus nassatus]